MYQLDVLERFHKDIQRDFRPEVSIKINKSEMDLLLVLNEVPDRPYGFYGHHIHLEKSSFSYVVDLLVLKGLVIKIEDGEDRRRKSLQLTPKGISLLNEITNQYEEYFQKAMSVFTTEELVDLENAVETIRKLSKKFRDQLDLNDRRHVRPESDPDHPHHPHPDHKPWE